MVEVDWIGNYYEKGEAQYPSEKSNLRIDDIDARKFKHLFLKRTFATVTLPDIIQCKSEDYVDTSVLPEELKESDYFKEFSYHIVKFTFGILPKNWKDIEHLIVFLRIEHKQERSLVVHTPSIFPVEEAVEIGKQVINYQLTKSLSVMVPDFSPVLGYNIPIDGGVDYKSQSIKKIEYGLKIPKVATAYASNNEATWKFEQNEAIGPRSQYRLDMITGLPLNKPKVYEVKVNLAAKVRNAINNDPIQHTVPIDFKSSL